MHKLFVLFNRFFKESGFNVVLSDATNRKIVALSQETALEETCYPVKFANGHVASLIQKKVDYIFLPTVYTMKHEVLDSGSPAITIFKLFGGFKLSSSYQSC